MGKQERTKLINNNKTHSKEIKEKYSREITAIFFVV